MSPHAEGKFDETKDQNTKDSHGKDTKKRCPSGTYHTSATYDDWAPGTANVHLCLGSFMKSEPSVGRALCGCVSRSNMRMLNFRNAEF